MFAPSYNILPLLNVVIRLYLGGFTGNKQFNNTKIFLSPIHIFNYSFRVYLIQMYLSLLAFFRIICLFGDIQGTLGMLHMIYNWEEF